MDQLKVLTLNCWGIPYISKDVPFRMQMIGEEISRRDFDLVALQEVWSWKDFVTIREAVAKQLPYSHYFINGIGGSGCCVLSRFPIVDAFFQQYTFNGYIWALTHGDYFGGKGLGCVIVEHPCGKVHFFNTHIHAGYVENDYFSVRTLQMYQFTQLIKHTTRPGDFVIACGDFNHEPREIGMQAISTFTQLHDSYAAASRKPAVCVTSNSNSNPYCKESEPEQRIDYIFHGSSFDCVQCSLDMQVDSATGMHFSDHEGYSAILRFVTNPPDIVLKDEHDAQSLSLLREMKAAMEDGQRLAEELQWRKIIVIWLLFLTFICMPVFSVDSFYLIFPTLSTWQGKGVFVLQIFSVIFCVAYLYITLINRRVEANAYRNVAVEIDTKLYAAGNLLSGKKEL